MSNLRRLAHLEEQLGEDRLAVLIDPSNTGKVKAFCEQLLEDALPTEITIGGHTYELLGILQGDETSVVGHTMATRAKEMNANLGEDDAEHFRKHQKEIPTVLRGKVVFVFLDSRHPDDPEDVACVRWDGRRWVRLWSWLGRGFIRNYRVPRRK